MGLLSIEEKSEIVDFFEEQAEFLVDRKIHLDLGLSQQDFYIQVVKNLRNQLRAAMSLNMVPPMKNSSNIIPCVLVIPEEAMYLHDQFAKLGLGEFKNPRVENRVKLAYYQRGALLTVGAWPYLAICAQIVVPPSAASRYLGDIDVALGPKKVMLGLDGLFAILVAHGLDERMAPWLSGGGRGDVALAASAKHEGDRISYPVVDFDSGWGILIKHFTSDKTKKASPSHRFLISDRQFRVH